MGKGVEVKTRSKHDWELIVRRAELAENRALAVHETAARDRNRAEAAEAERDRWQRRAKLAEDCEHAIKQLCDEYEERKNRAERRAEAAEAALREALLEIERHVGNPRQGTNSVLQTILDTARAALGRLDTQTEEKKG